MKIRVFITSDLFNKDFDCWIFNKLKDPEYHYLVNVLKIQTKESLYLFNHNKEVLFFVANIDKKSILLTKKDISRNTENINHNLHLLCPIIKMDKLIQIVKQSVEIGILNIHFYNSERTQDSKHLSYEKISKNAIEALEQSDGLLQSQIYKHKPLKDVLDDMYSKKLNIICGVTELNIKEHNLKNVKENQENQIKYNVSLIGPEGGFSNEEMKMIASYTNIHFINITKRVLRSETAAVALNTFLLLNQAN